MQQITDADLLEAHITSCHEQAEQFSENLTSLELQLVDQLELLVDKDTVTNAVSASHDTHLQKIDDREDELLARVNSWMSSLLKSVLDYEHTSCELLNNIIISRCSLPCSFRSIYIWTQAPFFFFQVFTKTYLSYKKKECTGELRNIKRPGRPRKTTVVDDRRILSMVKKNPFTTSSQVKDTLQEVGVSLSKSTIKRRLHESKYKGFTTRCQPFISIKNRKARLDFAKKHLKKPDQFWKSILWTDETKINRTKMTGRKKVWRRLGTAHDPKNTSSVKHGGGSVMAWACMASSGTGSLVFIDDVTEDRSSRMNSEVYGNVLSAQIKSNAAKLVGWRFTVQMDSDPKHTAKATQ
ncbi:unnamed protein product, partial [Leuciscus chuanchicus]